MADRRVILHVDMDAFFVSVELRRRPDLVGRPVVVGGTGRRGVVAAASYEARRYGVYSAMPSARARQLCPDAVFLAGDYEAYSTVSAQVRAIFDSVTPKVEPLSLDEAFLDVSGALALFGDGVTIGHRIRNQVRDELGLGCSVGVAPNKFLAKMASVEAKPRARPEGVEPGPGVFEVVEGGETAYLHPLPVRRLWGVGPSTYERLNRLGVRTIGDLTILAPAALRGVLGPAGADRLLDLAAGVDTRPVEVERPVKSISHEETFPFDLYDRAEIGAHLGRLADGVASRLRASGLGARTITIKVRDGTFRTVTRAHTLPRAVDTAPAILEVVNRLVDDLQLAGGVRLLGVATSKFSEPTEQLTLDGIDDSRDGVDPRWSDASKVIDSVRARFGRTAIATANALTTDGVRVIHRGRNPWGPDGADQQPPAAGSSRRRKDGSRIEETP
ncbi:DNA polymerase IV [Desertimonas flava]|uniref:DNA polymerase IV n=1 Tax=Desertimonas flava TaxID=2064846 RepID=UPI001968AEA9|nr:DNA polymerase IV [Desertimonas flava]